MKCFIVICLLMAVLFTPYIPTKCNTQEHSCVFITPVVGWKMVLITFLSCNKKELNEKYYSFDIGHTKFEIIFITAMVFTACNEKKQIILKEDKLLKLIYLHMPPLVTALFYRQTYLLFEPKHILYSW